MARVKDLVIALITVLIRYHDAQPTKACIQKITPEQHKRDSRELAKRLVGAPDLETLLTQFIGECTIQYDGRLPLLNIIKNQIIELTHLTKSDSPISAEEIEEYKRNLIEFFNGLHSLFKKRKDETIEVTIHRLGQESTSVSLCGFQNVGFSSWYVPTCSSGVIFNEEILALHPTQSTLLGCISKIVEDFCLELQQMLEKSALTESLTIVEDKRAKAMTSLKFCMFNPFQQLGPNASEEAVKYCQPPN